MRVIIFVCVSSTLSMHSLCLCAYVFACYIIHQSMVYSILQSNKGPGWLLLFHVSGPADYTYSYSCMQSVSFSFVCVSAQQSEEMSVSREEIDEHTQETKRLAS